MKIRETSLTLIVNISTYLNVEDRYIGNRLRQVLRLSEPIKIIYFLLGLDKNWVGYRVPQPRMEVMGRGRRGTRPGIAKGMAKWHLSAGRNSPPVVKNGQGTA